MCDRCQRSSLTSCGNVARTEIGHGGNSRSLGNHGRLCDLQRRTNRADTWRMDAMWKVMHCLSMRADQRHITRLEVRLPNHEKRRVRKPFTEQRIKVTDICNCPRNGCGENALL